MITTGGCQGNRMTNVMIYGMQGKHDGNCATRPEENVYFELAPQRIQNVICVVTCLENSPVCDISTIATQTALHGGCARRERVL